MSAAVVNVRRSLFWLALTISLTACGGDQPWECQKPADCVGKPGGNYCKVITGKGRCVVECLPAADGKDNCPPTYKCNGTADDGSLFCKPT